MNIPYRIEKIETKQFAIFPESLTSGAEVNISTSFTFSVSSDISHIRCVSNYKYEQEGTLLLVLELVTYFEIAPEGSSQITELGKIDVEFLRYMATIAVGTARGVIHSQSQGTQLNAIVLPPINLIPVITEDLILNKEQ